MLGKIWQYDKPVRQRREKMVTLLESPPDDFGIPLGTLARSQIYCFRKQKWSVAHTFLESRPLSVNCPD